MTEPTTPHNADDYPSPEVTKSILRLREIARLVRPQPGADVLHLYGQAFWHDEAYIGGGRTALLALRDAIGEALHKGDGSAAVFVSDGEGYTVHVVAMSDEDAMRQIVPYRDECAAEVRPWSELFGPWALR